jgi:hypothetical protein
MNNYKSLCCVVDADRTASLWTAQNFRLVSCHMSTYLETSKIYRKCGNVIQCFYKFYSKSFSF